MSLGITVVLTILVIGASMLASSGAAAIQAVITLDPNTKYQTIVGWEGTAQAGQTDCSSFSSYSPTLFDQAANDLGINRLRVEVKTKSDLVTFDLADLDLTMDRVVVPMRTRLAARGEKLFVNVNFVGKSNLAGTPSAYAQQVFLTYQHLQSKYGLVPDAWEVALEPGYVSPGWGPAELGNAIVSTGNLLVTGGFTPYFIAPSTPGGPDNGLSWFDQMVQAVPGSLTYLKELSYHRYGDASDATLQTIASRGVQYGINTSQLEHGGADYVELHRDLKYANVSAWQQYTVGYCTTDDGYQYYPISGSSVTIGSRTKFLRQYFKYVRAGAVRVGASTTNSSFDPLAFVNRDSKDVVVVKAASGGTFSVQGLPAGSYGVKYTTSTQYNADLPDVSVGAGASLDTSIPSAGVITIYGKSGTAAPTPGAPTATSVPPTRTPTSLPPTATSVPPTATVVPPTTTAVPLTSTAMPPTATAVPRTATAVPPTATAVPPTATALPSQTASSNATISANRSTTSPGDTVTVNASRLPNPRASYVVALYRIDGTNSPSLVGKTTFATNGTTSGSVKYKMPTTPGSFQFRLLTSSESELAESRQVTVKKKAGK